MKNDNIAPFTINVAKEVRSDLQLRLKNTRWSSQIEGTDWDAGTDLNYLKQRAAYWQGNFDWPRQEAALNQEASGRGENPTATAREIPEMERIRSETLKLFVVFDVGATV